MSSVKTHICDIKNLQQGRDLLISVNDRVISPIREDFIFTKLRINPHGNFPIYSVTQFRQTFINDILL